MSRDTMRSAPPPNRPEAGSAHPVWSGARAVSAERRAALLVGPRPLGGWLLSAFASDADALACWLAHGAALSALWRRNGRGVTSWAERTWGVPRSSGTDHPGVDRGPVHTAGTDSVGVLSAAVG